MRAAVLLPIWDKELPYFRYDSTSVGRYSVFVILNRIINKETCISNFDLLSFPMWINVPVLCNIIDGCCICCCWWLWRSYVSFCFLVFTLRLVTKNEWRWLVTCERSDRHIVRFVLVHRSFDYYKRGHWWRLICIFDDAECTTALATINFLNSSFFLLSTDIRIKE